LWERARIPDDALWFVMMNPFYHLVEIARAPLLGRAPEPVNWIVAGLVAVVLVGAGVALYSSKRSRLTYWL
jgi:ABC-type polysaccharide/polyol phosphate export permease